MVASLGFALWFLLWGPDLVGAGHKKIIAGGAAAGAGCAVTILRLCWPHLAERNRIGKVWLVAGFLTMGLLGGFGGAQLLNAANIVSQETVELPVVDKRLRHRLRMAGHHHHLLTIAVTPPLAADWQSVEKPLFDAARPGQCLHVIRHDGWLGGSWIDDQRLVRCSARRGEAGPAILAMEGAPDSWRWHRPISYRLDQPGHASETSIPTDMRCSLDRDRQWLYRCTRIGKPLMPETR